MAGCWAPGTFVVYVMLAHRSSCPPWEELGKNKLIYWTPGGDPLFFLTFFPKPPKHSNADPRLTVKLRLQDVLLPVVVVFGFAGGGGGR